MMFLASLHDREDWCAMKKGAMTEILDSFAWGNANAIELYESTVKALGVPPSYWESIRRAGERFNRFKYLDEVLHPRVAVIVHRGVRMQTYFEGYRYVKIWEEGRLAHYRLPDADIDVFVAPHPGSMNRIEHPDYFCNRLNEIFRIHGFAASFPGFLRGQQEGREAIEFLRRNAPDATADFDKFQFVAWVADELMKRNVFMSVPTLIELVNSRGYLTNRGNAFVPANQGPYKLVSATYHKMIAAGLPDRARNVALAFRKPNFEYAYSIN